MICFPLDNTEYGANALGAWCATRTRGVFAADGHYTVTSNDDMTVTVSPGLAWLKAGQFWGVNAFENDSQLLTIDTADGSLSRIDAVCVRLDKNQNRAEIVIKKGSYSPQTPTIAPPARDLDYDEIYVATISVAAGATSIRQIDITDRRLNEEYCGIMRDGVTGIPTQQLQAQWLDWLASFTAEARGYYQQYQAMVADLYTQYAADVAVHEQNAQQVFDDYVAGIAVRGQNADQVFADYTQRMDSHEQTAQADFQTWFDSIRGILDVDAAGHLQNEIDNALTRIADLEAQVGDLEITTGPPISTNPFTVNFTTLEGKIITGVWNNTLGRIEF